MGENMPTIQQQNVKDIAQDALEKMRAVAVESVNSSLEVSYNALVVSLAENVAKLPEQIFINRFLPFFSGQRPLSEYPKLFTDWISIAGAPNREVAIVDNYDNELFRVPSIISTDVIDLQKSGNFNEIFDQYELRSRQLPVIGNKFIAEVMAVKSKQILTNDPRANSREAAWMSIFARYNLIPAANKTSHKQTSLTVDDDLDYD